MNKYRVCQIHTTIKLGLLRIYSCSAMIRVTEEQIKGYMELYLKEYGVPIEYAKADKELSALVCLLETVHDDINQRKQSYSINRDV